jgi:large subunit ribosomal protein L17
VETTHAKARELKRLADRMITLGKRGDLHARRQAMRVVHGKAVTAKLFGELAERYATRPGGYTRVLRTRTRVGDAAEMSIVQLVEAMEAPAADEAPKKKASRKKTAKKAVSKKASTGKKSTAKKASKKKTAAKAESD